ncbi:MAG: superoxide dismutase [Mucinivorans sp.]
MRFTIAPLPYATNALEPLMATQTVEYHYGKHLTGYVSNLNRLIVGTEFEDAVPLEQIILRSSGPIYNNAAQVWNHTLFFNELSPNAVHAPTGRLLEAIIRDFGSFEAFKDQFTKVSLALFGSGWVWLVADEDDKLSVLPMGNAGNPATEGLRAVMTLDVWEHSYYLDHQNRRAEYIDNFWQLLDWAFVENNY